MATFIHTREGRLSAEYIREGIEADLLPSEAEPEGHRHEVNHIVLSRAIIFDGEHAGSITLHFDLHGMQERLQEFAGIGPMVWAAAVLVALGLSWKLQSVIATPILDLARTARRCRSKKTTLCVRGSAGRMRSDYSSTPSMTC